MCIGCRDRFSQSLLLRLQCESKCIQRFSGVGRSFYLCDRCLNEKNRKNLIRKLSTQCKREIKIIELESIING
ncbi:MAG: hypothetical protein DSZ06_01130 [Sulfurospirillum sp.]|nr:MAG: hypothetical protein DSZ06_01130 [Sulfurospirillum sp.]